MLHLIGKHLELEEASIRKRKRVLVSETLAKMIEFFAKPMNCAIDIFNGAYFQNKFDSLSSPLVERALLIGEALAAGGPEAHLPGQAWFRRAQECYVEQHATVPSQLLWSDEHRDRCTTRLSDGSTVVTKHSNSPDYSTVLGSSNFIVGCHEWELVLLTFFPGI